jgi:hypothetical protein
MADTVARKSAEAGGFEVNAVVGVHGRPPFAELRAARERRTKLLVID